LLSHSFSLVRSIKERYGALGRLGDGRVLICCLCRNGQATSWLEVQLDSTPLIHSAPWTIHIFQPKGSRAHLRGKTPQREAKSSVGVIPQMSRNCAPLSGDGNPNRGM
jgi:hypothetical protein